LAASTGCSQSFAWHAYINIANSYKTKKALP